MPPIEEDDCWDTVVYWEASGLSDDQGQPIVAAPIELTYPNGVRWMPGEARAMDPKGNLISLSAQAIVCQEIPIGSRMWLGSLADWYGTGSGVQDDKLMVVSTFNRTGSLNNRFDRRTAGLTRYKNA